MAELLTLTHGVIHKGNLISCLQFDSDLPINHFLLPRFCSAPSVAAGSGPGLWAERALAVPVPGPELPFPRSHWTLSIRKQDNAAGKHSPEPVPNGNELVPTLSPGTAPWDWHWAGPPHPHKGPEMGAEMALSGQDR